MVLLIIQVQHFVTALRRLDWINSFFSKCVFLSNVTKYFISFHFYKTYLMFATLLDKNSLAKYTVFTYKFIIWQSQNKMYTQSTFHVPKPAAFIEINVSLFTYLSQQLVVVSEFQKFLELWFFAKIHILFLC